MTDIYWFQNDLRLQDNPGLRAHCGGDRLLLVYFWPQNRPWCNVTGMGGQRRRFLQESLQALQHELADLGQALMVIDGAPEQHLPALARAVSARQVGTARSPGFHERHTLRKVAAALSVPLQVHGGNTLFPQEQLPFPVEQLPVHFTPFKQQVETQRIAQPLPTPAQLPPPPMAVDAIESAALDAPDALPLLGGAAQGHARLRQWTSAEGGLSQYKQTRNCLDGMDGSSTLSPWLALGCISPREVVAAVREHEREQGESASSGWLVFELLWREFFHWRAIANDAALFSAGGTSQKIRHCTFEPRSFARWCQGDTNYPLVNALMRQLLATGWMSNRGRQIASSCLVNELGIDWRYGAAFFEKHLIDYDVASNYGNWQYLAGVGADPRGGRHFNLEKQAREHDPQGDFTRKWGGDRPRQPDFVTDAADWPLPATDT